MAGGKENDAEGKHSTIGGGRNNFINSTAGTVPGGDTCVVYGDYALAAGRNATAFNPGAFVWADSTDAEFSSSEDPNDSGVKNDDTFNVRASSGVKFVTNGGTTYISGGSTGWSTTSTRTAKTNIEPVDSASVLDGVREMEVSTWEYTNEDGDGAGVRHVGPMAKDFHDVLDVGDNEKHINSIDADGMAFAATQELAAELDDARETVEAKDEEIEQLQERAEELAAENEALTDRLAAVEDHLGLDGDTEPAPADD
ncbi:tail fiber domain-containing protein [Halovenus marina]|uniref:tail fiber domain-containing protein n=1 Tax=Halovenus marina TaxID=3396621 RepID=UPI003F55FF8D